MYFNKAYKWRDACKGQATMYSRVYRYNVLDMSLIFFSDVHFFFKLFMVKSHIFAMLWLLFIRCRQLENVIGFLSQIIIYIFRGCQILFWNKLNQNDISVRSLYINLFFLIKINFLWLKKNPSKTMWYQNICRKWCSGGTLCYHDQVNVMVTVLNTISII